VGVVALVGDGLTVAAQAIKVHGDGLLGPVAALLDCLTLGDAAGQGRHSYGVAALVGVGVKHDGVGPHAGFRTYL